MIEGVDARPRLLLVDDEPSNIAVLAEALRADYQLSVATSGEEALRLASIDPHPDLILLDVVMPQMSGFKVCESLRQSSGTENIPVIFVTAMDQESDEERGLALGAVDYIYKPFSPAIVRARVRLHLHLQLQQEFLQRLLSQRTADLQAAREEAQALLRSIGVHD